MSFISHLDAVIVIGLLVRYAIMSSKVYQLIVLITGSSTSRNHIANEIQLCERNHGANNVICEDLAMLEFIGQLAESENSLDSQERTSDPIKADSPIKSKRRARRRRKINLIDRKIRCPYCDRVYHSYQGLYYHKAKCPKMPPEMRRKLKVQIKNFDCERCKRTYTSYTGLYVHKKKCRGETPFNVSPLDTNINTKIQPITKAKNLTCEKCGRRYTSYNGWYVHWKKFCGRTCQNLRPKKKTKVVKVSCKNCGRHYRSYTGLYLHKKKFGDSCRPKVVVVC